MKCVMNLILHKKYLCQFVDILVSLIKFGKISKKEDEMSDVFEYLFPCDASPGDVIIQQGDEGDNFYIIDQVKLMLMS